MLDAADWFENNGGIKKGELRWNQFGGAIGGPIIKNKMFYFGDYEGFRRVQGNASTGSPCRPRQSATVVTQISRTSSPAMERAPRTDILGRSIPVGTVLDPATTRAVTAGVIDPVSGIAAPTRLCSRSVRYLCSQYDCLHAHRLRSESAPGGPDGSERRQAPESLPAAEQRDGNLIELMRSAPICPSTATVRRPRRLRSQRKRPDILPLQLCG